MRMLQGVLLTGFALALFSVPSRAAEFAPYRATIVSPSANVRSGPGENFYQTGTLAQGDVVDVYRQQANGWCAIRPPEGSFSWVYGRHVSAPETVASASGDGASNSVRVAQVEKPDVASRIGSMLSAQKNAVQVRLKQGETVTILGEEEIDGQTWFRIAPPAGEFRWIHTDQIRRVGQIPSDDARSDAERNTAPISTVAPALAKEAPGENMTVVTPTATTGSGAPPAAANSRYSDLITTQQSAPTRPVAAPLLLSQEPTAGAEANRNGEIANSGDAWRPAPNPISPMATTGPATVRTTPVSSGIANTTGAMPSPTSTAITSTSTAPQSTTTPITPITPITPVNSGDAAPSQQPGSLTQLELRLSRMVTEPPAAWNMEPLRADAQFLLASAPVADKPAIQATIAKIDRFDAIARRFRTANGISAESMVAPDGTRFDAVGVLRPVNSRRPGAPPFALVDERGQVVSFITPAAGMNLQSLIGQRIGVTGNRGFIPEFQRAHVVAGRALPILK
jgi:SH3-like domain-containing protein